MATLLERPGEQELMLLRVIAEGYASTGTWPVWQWVAREVRDRTHGADPRELVRGLPEWQHNYRPAYAVDSGSLDPGAPGHHMALTVVGMFHAADPTVNELMRCVVTAVAIAAETEAGARPPTPVEAIPVRITAQELVAAVSERTQLSVEPARLLACLRHEPWVWGGLVEQGDSAEWYWDLDTANLHNFHGIGTAASYLSRMEGVVGYPQVPAVDMVLPAEALAEAFDHLDLVWRLITTRRLLRPRRLVTVTTIAEPVMGANDFYAACSALADILSSMELEGNGGSLQRMADTLHEMLEDPSVAQQAVSNLRHVVALRSAQQHSGRDADVRADRARVVLGMDRFGTDWPAAWNHVRVVTVDALRTIREQLMTLAGT